MKNIISYSLWGDRPMYWAGALENIKMVTEFFPGWICRFYIDKNAKTDLINTIIGDNVETVLMDAQIHINGMFWRFNAAFDDNVNIFLSRDCDSRFSKRELNAINEWLESDKDFHIMRDHPQHTVPILGGMWGCRNNIFKKYNFKEEIDVWSQRLNDGADQDFLDRVVYPNIKHTALEHSEFNLKYGGDIRPFPTKRKNYEFVGDIFDANNIRHPEYWQQIYRLEKNKQEIE
tara:strand:+ start:805 stop:1500 length:696 start_codon:yes stop_codon:yes gene_type:complete